LARELMNTRLRIKPWLVSAALAICAVLPGLAAEPKKPLVGRWLLDRKGVAATMPYKLEWEFTTNQVIVRVIRPSGDAQEASRSKYTIETTNTPQWITVTLEGEKPEIRQGIFRIVRGELHLKQAVGGGPRPLDFGTDDYSVLKRLGQPDGAANGSQPVRSETNRTSSAAGSRR
jgi:hypothetical protein